MTDLKTYAALARAPFLLLPVTLVICGAGAAASGMPEGAALAAVTSAAPLPTRPRREVQ